MKLIDIDIATRKNNLNFTRLMAAISVTFGHSFAMLNPTGAHYDIIPGIHSAFFGFFAVAIFFGLSGLLIAQSFLKSENWRSYLIARCLRIFPGLLFANFITVLLVGLFVKRQGWELPLDGKNWQYLINATLFRLGDYHDVFKSMPHNSTNGSLWTLPIEFRMYLFVLVVGICGFLKNRFLFLTIAGALFLFTVFQIDFVVLKIFPLIFNVASYDGTYLSLPLCFGFGMIAYLFREKFELNILLSLFAIAIIPAIDGWLYMTVAVVYGALTFGLHPRLYIPAFNFKNDLSYGVYVLSWPIQQTLIYLKIVQNPFVLFGVSMCLILPLAFISWRYVERPALKIKSQLASAVNRWILIFSFRH